MLPRFLRGSRGGRAAGADSGEPAARPQAAPGAPVASCPADEAIFRVLLARAPQPQEREEVATALSAGSTTRELGRRILSSPEFRLLYGAYKDGGTADRRPGVVEALLAGIGPDDEFVERCYEYVFDRPADQGGRAHFLQALAGGAERFLLVRDLLASDEFEARYREICPDAGCLPRDVQLCELANPAKWDNPEWMALLRSLREPADRLSMHRKTYEFTQMLFGLGRLGQLRAEAQVLSVGAGHEKPLYWLACRVARVVATDLYEGTWQSSFSREGDTAVFDRPEAYAPFEYPRERLVFLKMDGRHLAFRDATFDVVYSLSSIEHFGGLEGARASVAEMARVLKPGGVLALATEYCLSGPPHHEAFQPAEVRQIASDPRLRLVEPVDERVYHRYQVQPVDLRRNRYQTPHMAVRDGDTVFTSVMMFFTRT
jgi:SAM-dependent methyltransferase